MYEVEHAKPSLVHEVEHAKPSLVYEVEHTKPSLVFPLYVIVCVCVSVCMSDGTYVYVGVFYSYYVGLA